MGWQWDLMQNLHLRYGQPCDSAYRQTWPYTYRAGCDVAGYRGDREPGDSSSGSLRHLIPKDLYLVEIPNHVVRKNPIGQPLIKTIAGTGQPDWVATMASSPTGHVDHLTLARPMGKFGDL